MPDTSSEFTKIERIIRDEDGTIHCTELLTPVEKKILEREERQETRRANKS